MSSPRYSCCILRAAAAAAACRLPHAACLVPAWQSTHLFLCLCLCCCCGWGLPLVIVVNYLCISKFIWNMKANALLCSALLALLCSLDAAQLCPGQEFHSMAFQMLFFLASRIAHLFVAVCWFYVLFFLLHLPQMGAQSGARTPRALRPHMVTLICPQPLSLSLLHTHTPSHFLGRAANNLCVFPWVWFIFPSAFQQLKQSAFLRAEAPRDVVVVVVVVQSSMLNVECWYEKGCLLLDTPDGWFRSIHLILYSILRHFTTFVYFDAGHEVFQLNHTLYG